MSNIESGFCTVEEYTAFEEHRCLESEFQVDELYMMMFALKSRRSYEQAAKKPSRITEIEQRDSGLYLVKMTILNDDLDPDCDTRGFSVMAIGCAKDHVKSPSAAMQLKRLT